MLNRYALIALGVGAYLAFALSLFPAATAYRYFAPDALRLSGVEGTLWSGRAALGSAEGLSLRDIAWSLEALPLLTGRAAGRAQARFDDGFLDALFNASPGRVLLRNVRASTSVAALAAVAPALEGIAGLLSVQLERMELRDGWPVEVVGSARIGELAAPSLMAGSQAGLIPLGNYELTFVDAAEAGIEAQFRDTGGPLAVSGSLSLDAQRNYRLEGAVAARPDASRELVQALEFMTGEPRSDGSRPFELSGSL